MHNIHLVLAVVWVFVGVAFVTWSMDQQADTRLLLSAICGLFAFYNVARWFLSRNRTTPRPAPRPEVRHEKEPANPAFDFSDDSTSQKP